MPTCGTTTDQSFAPEACPACRQIPTGRIEKRKSKGCKAKQRNHPSSKATKQRNRGSLLQNKSGGIQTDQAQPRSLDAIYACLCMSMQTLTTWKTACTPIGPIVQISTIHVQNDWFTVRPGLCQSKPFRQQEDGADQAKMKHACHERKTKIRSQFQVKFAELVPRLVVYIECKDANGCKTSKTATDTGNHWP